MTTHVIRRLNSVAGKSFNPLGGGAGSGSHGSRYDEFTSMRRFNPLGDGAGSGSQLAAGS